MRIKKKIYTVNFLDKKYRFEMFTLCGLRLREKARVLRKQSPINDN